MRPQPARILSIEQENARTRTYTLDASTPAAPGQFAMLWLPGLDEKPFSLLDHAPLRFTIAAVGPFTRALARLAPGDTVWWRGPFGRPFRPIGTDHVLVGGGYGVAPMLLLARRLRAEGHRVRSVIGARNAEELLLVDATRAAGAELHLSTDDGSAGTRGRVTDVVTPWLNQDPPDTLYACGPHPMLAALAAACAPAGIPAQLSWEAYMRCGIGICGSCEHDGHGHLLCADGPVLDHPPSLAGDPLPPDDHGPRIVGVGVGVGVGAGAATEFSTPGNPTTTSPVTPSAKGTTTPTIAATPATTAPTPATTATPTPTSTSTPTPTSTPPPSSPADGAHRP